MVSKWKFLLVANYKKTDKNNKTKTYLFDFLNYIASRSCSRKKVILNPPTDIDFLMKIKTTKDFQEILHASVLNSLKADKSLNE